MNKKILTKKELNELIKNTESFEIIEYKDLGKRKYWIQAEGYKKDMANNDKGFSQKQLEQLQGLLQPIVNDIKDIKSRLDILESFHKKDIDNLNKTKKTKK